MSFLPLMFSDWWEDLDQPHRLPAQNFAVGVNPDTRLGAHRASPGYFYSHPWQAFRNFYLPRRAPVGQDEQGQSVVKPDKDKFHVALDIQQFTPDEIKVKVINNYVLVEGKHDEKRDEHGSITRHFIRKYLVPEQCDIDKVTASLSSDGVLTLNAPRKDQPRSSEREIEIVRTGKPAVAVEKTSKDDIEGLQTEKTEEKTSEDDVEDLETEETEKKTTENGIESRETKKTEETTSEDDIESPKTRKTEETTSEDDIESPKTRKTGERTSKDDVKSPERETTEKKTSEDDMKSPERKTMEKKTSEDDIARPETKKPSKEYIESPETKKTEKKISKDDIESFETRKSGEKTYEDDIESLETKKTEGKTSKDDIESLRTKKTEDVVGKDQLKKTKLEQAQKSRDAKADTVA